MSKITEKDALYDVLNFYKYSIGIYSTMLSETSDPNTKAVIFKNLKELFDDQFKIFQIMSTLGYYQTKPAKPEDLQMAKQQAKTMEGELV